METPMEELYERVEKMLAYGGDDDLRAVLIHINMLREKEKQVIIEAYNSGYDFIETKHTNGEQYYKETFNK
jgi:hypothetical protein